MASWQPQGKWHGGLYPRGPWNKKASGMGGSADACVYGHEDLPPEEQLSAQMLHSRLAEYTRQIEPSHWRPCEMPVLYKSYKRVHASDKKDGLAIFEPMPEGGHNKFNIVIASDDPLMNDLESLYEELKEYPTVARGSCGRVFIALTEKEAWKHHVCPHNLIFRTFKNHTFLMGLTDNGDLTQGGGDSGWRHVWIQCQTLSTQPHFNEEILMEMANLLCHVMRRYPIFRQGFGGDLPYAHGEFITLPPQGVSERSCLSGGEPFAKVPDPMPHPPHTSLVMKAIPTTPTHVVGCTPCPTRPVPTIVSPHTFQPLVAPTVSPTLPQPPPAKHVSTHVPDPPTKAEPQAQPIMLATPPHTGAQVNTRPHVLTPPILATLEPPPVAHSLGPTTAIACSPTPPMVSARSGAPALRVPAQPLPPGPALGSPHVEMAKPIGVDLEDVAGKVANIGAHGGQGLVKDPTMEEHPPAKWHVPCEELGDTTPIILPAPPLSPPTTGHDHTHTLEDPRPTTNLPLGPCHWAHLPLGPLAIGEPPILEDPGPTIALPPTPDSATLNTTGDGPPKSLGAPSPHACASDTNGGGTRARFERIWQTCQHAFGFWNPSVFPLSFTWYETNHQLVMRHPINGHWEIQDEDEAMERMSVDGGTGGAHSLWANAEDNQPTRDGSGSIGDEFSDPGADTHSTNSSTHPLEATGLGYKEWPNHPAPHYWNLPPASATMDAQPPPMTAPIIWVRARLHKHIPPEEMQEELEVNKYPHQFKKDVLARLGELRKIPQGSRINHITRDRARMAQPFQHLTWRPFNGDAWWKCHCDWGKCTDFIKDLKRTKVADVHDTFGKWQEVPL